MTITEKINKFVESRDISPVTATSYRFILNRFIKYLVQNGMSVTNIEFQHVVNYKLHISKKTKDTTLKKLSGTTIRSHLSIIRVFSTYLKNENLGTDFAKAIKLPPKNEEFRRKPINRQQILRLMSGITGSDLLKARARAIITLMIANGLRCVEVSRLSVNDIRTIDNQQYIFILGKGRSDNPESLPIHDESVEAVNKYLELRGTYLPTDPMFLSHSVGYRSDRLTPRDVSRIVSSQMHRLGLKGPEYTAHSLRHTTASLMKADGFDIYEIKNYLRHRNISTTEIYLRNAYQLTFKIHKPHMLLSKVIRNTKDDSNL